MIGAKRATPKTRRLVAGANKIVLIKYGMHEEDREQPTQEGRLVMMILTTRTLHRRQEDGGDAEVVLTIFEPEQHEADDWRCVFDFDPPIKPRNVAGRGMDWIDAFVHSLAYARLYFESQWSKTGHWQGMSHLGLPETAETPRHDTPRPPPLEARGESLPVLTTRRFGIPSGNGSIREISLMLYSPFSTQPGLWKCAFSFDPMDGWGFNTIRSRCRLH
ncbi:MAG: hypothetical protein IPM54_02710 [Polyangiaceae bacterium]|nr:hypothetical protein [Polyangiaceae bacterium]